MRPVLVLVVFLATLPSAAHAGCGVPAPAHGTNPAPIALDAELRAAAAQARVPYPLLAAIAYQEGFDASSVRRWVQFNRHGRTITSGDGGVGVMQLTDQCDFDQARLASDWRYNVHAGAQVLRTKWQDSQRENPPSLGTDDEAIAENWWGAVYRYNGQGADAQGYADTVFALARDPQGEAAAFVPPLPGLRTPHDVFGAYHPALQFQGRRDAAVFTDAEGRELACDESFTPTSLKGLPDRPRAPRVAETALGSEVGAAVALSRAVFADAGHPQGSARHVLLARDDDWADSLAGAGLAGDWGPVLYAPGGSAGTLPESTRMELRRVLPPGGTIYVLGGTAAISPAVEQVLVQDGYRTLRIAGATRLETSLVAAREVVALAAAQGQPAAEVLVARADDPADALTGGAAAGEHHLPLVLAPGAGLAPDLAEAIAGLGTPRAVALGGEAALSPAVTLTLEGRGLAVERLSGVDRWATAVAVAERLWGGIRRDVLAVDLTSPEGWAWALAAGPLSALLDAPQLGVAPAAVPPATLDAIRAAAPSTREPVRAVVVGAESRTATAARDALAAAASGF